MEKPKGRFVPKTGDYVPNKPSPMELDSLLFMKTPEAKAKYSQGTWVGGGPISGEWDEAKNAPRRHVFTQEDIAELVKFGSSGTIKREDLLQMDEHTTLAAGVILDEFKSMGIDSDTLTAMPYKRQRAIYNELKRRLLRTQKQTVREEIETLQAEDAVLSIKERICEILLKPLVMEKPQGSSLHHFMQYLSEIHPPARPEFIELLRNEFQLFVIEHDWAKAFGGSGDFGEGEIQMPFDFTCFEMRISGMRVLVMVCGGNRITFIALGVGGQWVGNKYQMEMDGTLHVEQDDPCVEHQQLLPLIRAQIRAVCIMLDAEVAETELRRAPEKLNRVRERQGRTLLRDYHVVRLAHRHRVRAAETRAHDDPGTRKRLHFRRGHDRHYPNYKVWIKWQLVGDPDLGFVDKEYRL